MNTLATVTPAQLDTLTVPTLRKLAAEAEISGRSKMLRAELVEALTAEIDRRADLAEEKPHRHIVSYAHSIVTANGMERGTCMDCGVEIARPVAEGVAPAHNTEQWVTLAQQPYQGAPAPSILPAESVAAARTATGPGARMTLTGKRAHRTFRKAERKNQRAARRKSRV